MTGRIIYKKDGTRQHFLDGVLVSEQEFDAAFPRVVDEGPSDGTCLASFPPLHSEALAVHPTQIQEATEDAKRKGVPVEFDTEGRPVFTSSRQFREYAKKYGFRHKSYF